MDQTQLDIETFNELKGLLDEEFPEFINIFMEDTEIELTSIKQGIQEKNCNQIADAAHKLKSSAAYIGAYQLSSISEQLELQANKNCTDDIDNVYKQANASYTELKGKLI